MFLRRGPRHFLISIHAPREGGDVPEMVLLTPEIISIHAPREGGDDYMAALLTSLGISIHAPREGGDVFPACSISCVKISIHAPREGGDYVFAPGPPSFTDFNPRPPRGGRPGLHIDNLHHQIFQSTPPARGATLCFCAGAPVIY